MLAWGCREQRWAVWAYLLFWEGLILWGICSWNLECTEGSDATAFDSTGFEVNQHEWKMGTGLFLWL